MFEKNISFYISRFLKLLLGATFCNQIQFYTHPVAIFVSASHLTGLDTRSFL